MKKSLIFFIFVIYISSIFIIGFFGVQIRSYNATINAEKIEISYTTNQIEDQQVTINSQGIKEIRLIYDYSYEGTDQPNPNWVTINYKVLPENTHFKRATINFEEKTFFTFDSDLNTFWFTRGNRTVTVYIKSTDGRNLTETIIIYFQNP